MSGKNQLQKSGNRIQKQGVLWLQQTRKAGEVFAGETQAAGRVFVRDVTQAGQKLATDWQRSTAALRKTLQKEALDWQKLVFETRDAYAAAAQARVRGLEAHARNTQSALKPDALESAVLESTRDLLAKAQTTVEQRIDKAEAPAKPAAKAKPRRKSTKPKATTKKPDAPIRNYDQLSAKDVVSRVQRLSGPQATAVLEYERAKKKRATVIRAAQKRLAVGS